MLTAQSMVPDSVLQPFIYCYVQRETCSSDGEIVEPVIPRSGTMLEFQFATAYEVRAYETEELRASWATTVIGPIDSRKVRLILRGRVQSLVVLFRPLGLYRLFRVPIAKLTGAGTEGDAVLGAQVSALYQRIGNMPRFADRVQTCDRFFIDRLLEYESLTPAAGALRMVASGRCSVRAAAAKAGISERQLERKSLELIGVPPRTLSLISRFQRAIAKHQSGFGNWMEIAHEVGYYDQMHLIRSFHELGGGPPTEVMKEIEKQHLISYCCG